MNAVAQFRKQSKRQYLICRILLTTFHKGIFFFIVLANFSSTMPLATLYKLYRNGFKKFSLRWNDHQTTQISIPLNTMYVLDRKKNSTTNLTTIKRPAVNSLAESFERFFQNPCFIGVFFGHEKAQHILRQVVIMCSAIHVHTYTG